MTESGMLHDMGEVDQNESAVQEIPLTYGQREMDENRDSLRNLEYWKHQLEVIEFDNFLDQMDINGDSWVVANEDFLLDFLQTKCNLGMNDMVIKVLKNVGSASHPGFLRLWDEAHYSKYQQHDRSPLTALQRYRIRKRNKPPPGICADGQRPKLRMPEKARGTLEAWYRIHEHDPYPSRQTKQNLSEKAGITMDQVNTWFANTRRKRRKVLRQLLNRTATSCQSHNAASTKTQAPVGKVTSCLSQSAAPTKTQAPVGKVTSCQSHNAASTKAQAPVGKATSCLSQSAASTKTQAPVGKITSPYQSQLSAASTKRQAPVGKITSCLSQNAASAKTQAPVGQVTSDTCQRNLPVNSRLVTTDGPYERRNLFNPLDIDVLESEGMLYKPVYNNWPYNNPATIPTPTATTHDGLPVSQSMPKQPEHVNYKPIHVQATISDNFEPRSVPPTEHCQSTQTTYLDNSTDKHGTCRNTPRPVSERPQQSVKPPIKLAWSKSSISPLSNSKSDISTNTKLPKRRRIECTDRVTRKKPKCIWMDRLRMKLGSKRQQEEQQQHQQQQHAQIMTPKCETCAAAFESLNALGQLCDSLESTVISPIDYAKTVEFGVPAREMYTPGYDVSDTGYDVYCSGNVVDTSTTGPIYQENVVMITTTTGGVLQDTVQQDTYQVPLDQVTCAEPQWTQRVDNTCHHGYRTPVHDLEFGLYDMRNPSRHVSMYRLYGTTSTGEPVVNADPSRIPHDHRPLFAPQSPTYTIESPYVDYNNNTLPETMDTANLQVSYGTIVGEAIQGLLNLSSQDSDSSL